MSTSTVLPRPDHDQGDASGPRDPGLSVPPSEGTRCAAPPPAIAPSHDLGKEVLDACCGGRMFWHVKENDRVLFMDKRRVEKGAFDNGWNPKWEPIVKRYQKLQEEAETK